MKNVIIIADHHYYEDENGVVYVPSVYGYAYWKRYLNVFEKIIVLARGHKGESFDKEKMIVASGENVSFRFVYDFSGIKGLVKSYGKVKKQFSHAMKDADGAIIRVPSPLSRMAVNYSVKHRLPFAVEVAADPEENYDNVPFSKMVKRVMASHCRKSCIKANGAAYVTRFTLQKKYPPNVDAFGDDGKHFKASYSNVELSAEAFKERRAFNVNAVPEIIHVANMINGDAKGHYVMLDILSILKSKGLAANLVFVGDGPEVPLLKKRADELAIAEQIKFIGRIADMSLLYEAYRAADFFVLPSKTEGLPRSLLEAMACGLVCMASDVGGIPEILERDFLFKWDDGASFAEKLFELWKDSDKLNMIGELNVKTASEYTPDKLQRERDLFYGKLKGIM